jgi:hypothetical protein
MNALTLCDIRSAGAVTVQVDLPDLKELQQVQASRLWHGGKRILDIATAIGVPVTTLRGWIVKDRVRFPFRCGVNAPPPAPKDESEAMLAASHLWAEGLSRGAIVAATGVTKATLIRWANSHRDLFAYRRARVNGHVVVPAEARQAERPEQRLAGKRPTPAAYLPGLDSLIAGGVSADFGPRRLMDARACHCRWPLSGTGAETLFCGGRVLSESSYCRRHHRLAYAPAPIPSNTSKERTTP